MGEVRGHPPCAGHGERGHPPPPIKGHPFPPSSSHLLVKDLSPPLELFPHGLELARYMFPMAFRLEGVAASAASLERGGGGCSMDGRVCEHGCAANLRRWTSSRS